ncbi:MAG: hypothetical protein GXO85_13835, partial [Chlorobi bacterium]|nr:hypothetical protein [Chlorobiota bacterium]
MNSKIQLFIYIILLLVLCNNTQIAQSSLDQHISNFIEPPMDYWPHTRWWWPGNATSKENITYELEQMRSHGIRGVEQITMAPVYEKGNSKYLSDDYMELVKYTVKEAKRLGMEVAFNFGGPGWIIGGEWVADKDKSRDMIPTFLEINGPVRLNRNLPNKLIKTGRSWEVYKAKLSGDEKLLAVVAGKITEGVIDPNTLTILTEKVTDNKIAWEVPEGKWKIMCFWLSVDKSNNAVNHFDKGAMERYCNYLGGKYKDAVGDEFGKTVESFFCDSFELPYLASGIKWSDGLLQKFEEQKGYDLTKYLPAIWWSVEDISPKIKYDVNQFLAELGLHTFFETFIDWCHANGVKGRIQPYGFETDILKSAGMVDIPEMEITAGEKDQHPWFDTRIGPKKYVASGAHIYGKKIISVEAYTYLHWERYRATLEEIKIASDVFLRSGATKFYNHGYSATPERDLAPSRPFGVDTQIKPTNVWWKYYPLLAQYIARCSYILRQGDFAPDIAIYSPLANQWTKDVLNARRWTRDFDWGELGDLLISNGYDFDLLNDDALQNIAEFENGNIKIRNFEYKVLLIPNIEAMPLNTIKRIAQYVDKGGTVVALDRLPEFSTGYINYSENDKKVKKIVSEMFGKLNGNNIEPKRFGRGNTHYLKRVIHREIWWDQYSSMLDPFLKILKKYVQPDFGIDFAYEELRKNNGLTFYHRKIDNADLYFVSNIQDRPVSMPIEFRVNNKKVWNWNPYNGDIDELFNYSYTKNGTKVPIDLQPWESTIIIFDEKSDTPHVNKTNINKIVKVSDNSVLAEIDQNGAYFVNIVNGVSENYITNKIKDIPSPLIINGNWNLILESEHFQKVEEELKYLTSWTDDKKTKHFSGTGKYNIQFQLPGEYIKPDLKLELDLGKIGNIGEVLINGREAGTVWMKGQRCDITDLVKKGENELTVYVTNTNINRVSSFKEVVPVPENLVERYGRAIIPASL